MAFPAGPLDGQLYTDPTTNRTWFYEAAILSWRLKEKTLLSDYTTTDLTTVPPSDGELFAYDAAGGHFQNDSTVIGVFDALIDNNAVAPTSADVANAGEVWRDSTNEDAYLCITYVPPQTATVITVPATATNSLTVNDGQAIAQSFEIFAGQVFNRLTIFTGTTDTVDLQLRIYPGTTLPTLNPPAPILDQTFVGINLSPGPQLFSFTDTYLAPGDYLWKIDSINGNNPFAVRRSAGTGYTDGGPVPGQNTVHSLTLLGANEDWGFEFGYDIPTGNAEWLPVADSTDILQRVWRDDTPPPITPYTDGLLWHDTTVGRTYMWDIDILAWVQL